MITSFRKARHRLTLFSFFNARAIRARVVGSGVRLPEVNLCTQIISASTYNWVIICRRIQITRIYNNVAERQTSVLSHWSVGKRNIFVSNNTQFTVVVISMTNIYDFTLKFFTDTRTCIMEWICCVCTVYVWAIWHPRLEEAPEAETITYFPFFCISFFFSIATSARINLSNFLYNKGYICLKVSLEEYNNA